MEYLALKITGKAFNNEPDLLNKYIRTLKRLVEEYRLIVVTGGGRIARNYIDIAREIGVSSNYWLDLIGIWSSRLNSLLLISALTEYTYPRVPVSIEEAITALSSHRVVVMGGLIPGQSTASVLLEVAEALGVKKVYYYSAIGKVYTKDPLRHPDAKPLDTVTISELREILEQKALPGEYALIDVRALDIAIRSSIEIQVLDYREPEQIFSALSGLNPGSIVVPR